MIPTGPIQTLVVSWFCVESMCVNAQHSRIVPQVASLGTMAIVILAYLDQIEPRLREG